MARCQRCHRAMKRAEGVCGACACGGLIEAYCARCGCVGQDDVVGHDCHPVRSENE